MFWPDFIRNQYINRTTGWLLDDAVYLQQYIDKEVVVEKGGESATKLVELEGGRQELTKSQSPAA